MLRRVGVTAVAAAVIALAVGGGSLTLAAGGTQAATQSFTVRQTLTSFHIIDLGRKGWSAGDTTTFTKTFADGAGHQVGKGDGACVITRVAHDHPTAAECGQTFRFAGGIIQSDSVDLITSKAVFPITGGTGRYKGVSGEVFAGFQCDECFTFRLAE